MNPKSFLHSYFKQFDILNDNELDLIISKCRFRKLKKYGFLLQEGEVMTDYNLVAKGALRFYYLDQDFKEYTLRFAFEKDWIGDLESYVHQSYSQLNLQAVENSFVFQISREDQKELMRSIPKLFRIFLFKYEDRLLQANKRILLNISAPAEERFENFIAQYGEYYNRIPDRHIASYIGVTPEFFSKLKNKKLKEYLEIN